MRRALVAIALVGAAGLVAATLARATPPSSPERLFFALEIEDQGRVVARPMLLGETGRKLSLRMVDPQRPDLTRLGLDPGADGNAYRIGVRLELPALRRPAVGTISLSHGEERRLSLRLDGEASVKLLLMRVESPEFEAFVDLARRERGRPAS